MLKIHHVNLAEKEKFGSGATKRNMCTGRIYYMINSPKNNKLLSIDHKKFMLTFMEQVNQLAAEYSPASVLVTCVNPPSNV